MTTTVPTEVPIGKARALLADIATAANEHYAQTTLTKHGKAVAKVVHPDAANIPDAGAWQAAQQAWERVVGGPHYEELPADVCRAIDALGVLVGCYYGHTPQRPEDETAPFIPEYHHDARDEVR